VTTTGSSSFATGAQALSPVDFVLGHLKPRYLPHRMHACGGFACGIRVVMSREERVWSCVTSLILNLGLHAPELGPVDKPVLAPARSERLGRRDTHVATAVTS
jgi:hypothetical protein